jgi:hypothetical protein
MFVHRIGADVVCIDLPGRKNSPLGLVSIRFQVQRRPAGIGYRPGSGGGMDFSLHRRFSLWINMGICVIITLNGRR